MKTVRFKPTEVTIRNRRTGAIAASRIFPPQMKCPEIVVESTATGEADIDGDPSGKVLEPRPRSRRRAGGDSSVSPSVSLQAIAV